MSAKHILLKKTRKQSKLAQHDIAFVLQLTDYSSISRWESGKRNPSLEALYGYHLLFDMPKESMYEVQQDEIKQLLCKQIAIRVQSLKKESAKPKTLKRIAYLESALTRITSPVLL